MPRIPDRDRVLLLLSEAEEKGLSNLRIKTELNLQDDRYASIRQALIDESLVGKTRGRGGGIRLTRKGEEQSPERDDAESTVSDEKDLYKPLVSFLEAQASEDEIKSVVWATDRHKKRGQWQNPDVTRITVERYKNLRKIRVAVTTYEVKQFPSWSVSAVYEAASHHRFSNEAYVVLEWPNGLEFSVTDPTYKLDQIVRECQRFGIGLATLHPYYTSYRLYPRLEPIPRAPDDEDVEGWLDYALSRNHEARKKFDAIMDGKEQ